MLKTACLGVFVGDVHVDYTNAVMFIIVGKEMHEIIFKIDLGLEKGLIVG